MKRSSEHSVAVESGWTWWWWWWWSCNYRERVPMRWGSTARLVPIGKGPPRRNLEAVRRQNEASLSLSLSLSSCFFLFFSPSSTQHPHPLGLSPFPFLDSTPSLLIPFFVPAENEPEARPRSKSVRSPAPPSVTAFSCRSRYHPWSKDLLLSSH